MPLVVQLVQKNIYLFLLIFMRWFVEDFPHKENRGAPKCMFLYEKLNGI